MRRSVMALMCLGLGVVILGCGGDTPERFSDRMCAVMTSGDLGRYPDLMPPGVAQTMRMRMSELGRDRIEEAGRIVRRNAFYSCELVQAETMPCADTAIGGLTPEKRDNWGLDTLDQCATLRVRTADPTRDSQGNIVSGAEREVSALIMQSRGKWYMDPDFLGGAF